MQRSDSNPVQCNWGLNLRRVKSMQDVMDLMSLKELLLLTSNITKMSDNSAEVIC